MAVDKHSQDAVAKLYAEWVSAGVKLSVAGFAATTKIMEAATQSIVSSRAKAPILETPVAEAAPFFAKSEEKPVAKAAKVAILKTVQAEVEPVKILTPEAASVAVVLAVAEERSVAVSQDDLKLISGIGPKLEQMLIRKGISSLSQIATLDSDGVAKLDAELNLNGRIQRDDWVGQAAKLAGNVGGQTWQN